MSPRQKVCLAPMALTSGGDVIISAAQFTAETTLDAVVGYAKRLGLPIFVGVVVPEVLLQKNMLKDIDDAAADIAGRLGGRISAKVSARSSGAQGRARRGQSGRPARHPRGRRPSP